MKIKFALIILLFLIIIFLFFKNDNYDIKIELKIADLSVKYIDENIACVFRDKLLQEKDIKTVTIFSSKSGCNIYIKFSRKNKNIEKIKNLILLEVGNFAEIESVKINDKYNLIYHKFLIFEYNNKNYFSSKEKLDACLKELLNLKICENIIFLGEQQIVNYIYFKNNDFLKYDFDVLDFKNFVKNNNIEKNSFKYQTKDGNYNLIINHKLDSVEKLKALRMKYKNQTASFEISDVFNIEEKLKTTEGKRIFFNEKPVLILAVSRKKFYPVFLFEFELKKLSNKYGFAIFNPHFKKQYETFLDDNISFSQAKDFIKNNLNIKNSLVFLGFDVPKTNGDKKYDEIIDNRIIVLGSYFDYLKNKKFSFLSFLGTIKTKNISFNFSNYKLEDYSITKQDLVSAILANRDGYILDNYFKNGDEIEIIFKKNENQRDNYVYSKKYKTLISENALIRETLNDDYKILAQRNGKYFYFKKFKNPSLFRRVYLQIRYLLSLFNLSI